LIYQNIWQSGALYVHGSEQHPSLFIFISLFLSFRIAIVNIAMLKFGLPFFA
jgi:hypothetical protein